ncbi:MAG TPA: hypothetical protein VGQ99_07520 [Tepidisphaeraceae bacterium]|jgi:hypothetical protein|nr:hypothetical protein [Tepidisphaeraceae bacterium]
MRRRLFTLSSTLSLLLFIATLTLWLRGQSSSTTLSFTYDRYLPDRSAASTQIHLISDKKIWLSFTSGRVGPFNGHLVWGYHINADQSGGRPRLTYYHQPYDVMTKWFFTHGTDGSSALGPLRWQFFTRTTPAAGEKFHSLRLGLSHWLLALLFLLPPILHLQRLRKSRRAKILLLCPTCGYDLRATPTQCPECGKITKTAAT